ncbi:hypothetical protein TraAM80_10117 [Trypanosoma rangeli]|uniref:Retrotransposon hot spot (RHS) protein n=1 Tax=Trypanosoma rangeli TaxID=5698 RepID=A0A3R7LEI3_TRYRA|nr:uncharacterized protein TraAM80_10117 [Trypanosoma rangeli]RNE95715.1 hypothetical protein TraAM80_10117 [Trypanosoma rangeli]|eukprot:RNE95715.1 hypothetical protein TraAM80_10117 [Trypanosoma rangeli]
MCQWRCLCVGQTGTLQSSRRREGKSSIPPGYQLFEDARGLAEQDVFFINQWKEFGQKDTVPYRTKGRLEAALKRVEEEEIRRAIAATVILDERVYRSVLNAT